MFSASVTIASIGSREMNGYIIPLPFLPIDVLAVNHIFIRFHYIPGLTFNTERNFTLLI
jgi:hypothetical protein